MRQKEKELQQDVQQVVVEEMTGGIGVEVPAFAGAQQKAHAVIEADKWAAIEQVDDAQNQQGSRDGPLLKGVRIENGLIRHFLK